MKNIISYYYDLHPTNILMVDANYYFEYKGNKYAFVVLNRPISEVEIIYKIDKELNKKNIMFHQIILNKENAYVTYVNNNIYVMLEINVNDNIVITLPEICYITNNSIDIDSSNLLLRTSWANLWEAKTDFLESQINEMGLKYPNLFTYANYYIGLCENAIMYFKSISKLNDEAYVSVCHKRMDDKENNFYLYNPLNIILDYRVRDIAEYIKSCFFNNHSAFDMLIRYFNNNYVTYKEMLLLYCRLLYPSYFFDMVDNIVGGMKKEKDLEKIISKSKEYEIFLINVHAYLSSLYNMYIPQVDWLIGIN